MEKKIEHVKIHPLVNRTINQNVVRRHGFLSVNNDRPMKTKNSFGGGANPN